MFLNVLRLARMAFSELFEEIWVEVVKSGKMIRLHSRKIGNDILTDTKPPKKTPFLLCSSFTRTIFSPDFSKTPSYVPLCHYVRYLE